MLIKVASQAKGFIKGNLSSLEIIRAFFSASLRKEVSHKGQKARSRKMLRIFLCALVSSWLNSVLQKLNFNSLKYL